MTTDTFQRKLTAILSADVVGYSRLMEADEAWTIKSLEENRELITELVEEYKGRVVDAPGDNVLAEFSSVINAVECAVKIQKELNKKNSKLMEEHRMNFRIGVNLGDVVEDNSRIYGNGLNIAARLEGLAEPGGICISHTAYDQVKNKINVDYDYLGEYQVKNINEPVRVYRILMGWESPERDILHKAQKKINPLSIAITAIILLVLALGTTITILYPKPSELQKVVRFSYELPEDQQFNPQALLHLAVSSDGTQIAYSTTKGIYVRDLDTLEARRISGTDENPHLPFFSPDGQWLGYFSIDSNQLKVISTRGGAPRSLANSTWIAGAVWNYDDTIVYGDIEKGIMRIPTRGGQPETLIEAKNEELILPQILPDGKSILCTIFDASRQLIAVQSLESGERKLLFEGLMAKYLPTGHLFYYFDNNLLAVPFDIDALEVTGSEIVIVENAMRYDISDSGTMIYIPEYIALVKNRNLYWVDRDGEEEPITQLDSYFDPRISPDGNRVALTIGTHGENEDIWILDLVRGKKSKRTFHQGRDVTPLWTPDGKRIVFWTDREGGGIYWKAADGSGQTEHLISTAGIQAIPLSWSRDGKTLILEEDSGESTGSDITSISIENDYTRKILMQSRFIEKDPQISPDGQWIAYTSNETGQYEVYVRPFPDMQSGGKYQISSGGGHSPLWSPDGQELYYRGDFVMKVDIETEPTFMAGIPERLFRDKYFTTTNGFNWDISPNGKKFMMIERFTTENVSIVEIPRKIIVVTNWIKELKQRVPVD